VGGQGPLAKKGGRFFWDTLYIYICVRACMFVCSSGYYYTVRSESLMWIPRTWNHLLQLILNLADISTYLLTNSLVLLILRKVAYTVSAVRGRHAFCYWNSRCWYDLYAVFVVISPNSIFHVTSRCLAHAFWHRKKSWRDVSCLSGSTAQPARHDAHDTFMTCTQH